VTLSVNFRVALRLGSTFLTLVPELLQTQTHDLRVEQIQSVLVDQEVEVGAAIRLHDVVDVHL
jgi:hypothetical protein